MAIQVAANHVFNEFIELMNSMVDSPSDLNQFQIARLKKEADKINKPNHFACLAALYSNIRDVDSTIKNATITLNYRDYFSSENAFVSLYNLREYDTICELYLKNTWVNSYDHILQTILESAVNSINIEVFNMCLKNIKNIDITIEKYTSQINNIISYLNKSDNEERIFEYIKYAFKYIYKNIDYKYSLKILTDELIEDNTKFLSFTFSIDKMTMDEAVDIEFELLEHISNYNEDFDIKNAISFQIEGVIE